MTAQKKAPDTYSAPVTARAISRRLKRAGFLMADTRDRYRWTEGFYVKQVGCSRWVSIDYHTPRNLASNTETYRANRREKAAKVREFLTAAGYVFDPDYPSLLYVRCERDS